MTTKKKNNLILNVDGCIGVLLVDLLKELKFSDAEIDQMIKMGLFNALFVLGRSIGLMGHYFDQNRLEQGLYRHPLDDILYDVPERPRGVGRNIELCKLSARGAEAPPLPFSWSSRAGERQPYRTGRSPLAVP